MNLHQLTCGSNVWPLFVLCVVYYLTTKRKALWCLLGWGMYRSWHIFVTSRLNVCMQPFVTKLGIVVHHHESECHAQKSGTLSSRSRSQCGLICNGVEWSKDKTQAAESIKWRPQQANSSNQFLLVQPQTVFSTPTKSSRSRIDKRTARATGNTRYRYSKNGPLDHKMADNCVSLARTNTLSSTITKLIKTSKTSNKSYSYHLLNRINKMYTHDLFYLHKEWEAWLAPVYIQIRTTKSQLTQCTKYKCH